MEQNESRAYEDYLLKNDENGVECVIGENQHDNIRLTLIMHQENSGRTGKKESHCC